MAHTYKKFTDDVDILIGFINYNKKIHQDLSLPYFIIEYISINCNVKLSRKLMSLCKYLRCLQVRVGFCHIHSLRITREQSLRFTIRLDEYLDDKLYCFFDLQNISQFTTEFKAIKVWDEIYISDWEADEITDDFIKLLDLSELKTLLIHSFWTSFSYKLINCLVNSPVKKLEIFSGQILGSVLTSVFPKLLHLSDFSLISSECHTLETFKDLINTRRKMKLSNFCLAHLSDEIKGDHIFEFIDLHMDVQGQLALFYCYVRECSKFISDIQATMEERKEKKIPTCNFYIDYYNPHGSRLVYDQI